MTHPPITPDDILAFWFPDGPDPELAAHTEHWVWRMRGGAHEEVIAKYSDITKQAVNGELDHWAQTPKGRMALIILLDQFSRSVFAGTPQAYAQDPKALALCLEGLDNGHYDSLDNVWQKSVFKLPMEHCECAAHLANLDRVAAIAREMIAQAPERLRPMYEFGAEQPLKHRAVIAKFGRFPHRNDILARISTPEEQAYIDKGDFPHQSDIRSLGKEPA